MATTVKTNFNDVKRLINYTIDNGFELEKQGKTPVAICLEAEPGIGKTSIFQQVAEERGMGFVKLNVAQMDEAGDLIGFPITEHECQVKMLVKDENGEPKVKIAPKTAWVTEQQMENHEKNIKYCPTGKTRMAYAKPAWVPEYNEKGNLVLFDDHVRANPSLLQALMDLILEQKYVSWKFPEKTIIGLTNNPDNGENNVNSLDEAQRTRFMNYNVAFSIDAWMKWAEENNIDGRCINFVSTYYNGLFEADEEGNRICNPRSFVMFANMIQGIKDWDSDDNRRFITLISKGCFNDDGKFSQMFNSFLRSGMHLLIQPQEILKGKWDEVEAKLHRTLYGPDDTDYDLSAYRPDIATVLSKRFANYVGMWLMSDEKTPIKVVQDRLVNFIDAFNNGRMFFNKELLYNMLKTITSDNRNQTNKLLYEPKIAKILQ